MDDETSLLKLYLSLSLKVALPGLKDIQCEFLPCLILVDQNDLLFSATKKWRVTGVCYIAETQAKMRGFSGINLIKKTITIDLNNNDP